MQDFVLLLDLKNDPELIAQYEQQHQKIWPEVAQHLSKAGIINMQIHRFQNRLAMLVQADEQFSWQKLDTMAENNPRVQAWEKLMDNYQQRFPNCKGKWQLATQIFDLQKNQ